MPSYTLLVVRAVEGVCKNNAIWHKIAIMFSSTGGELDVKRVNGCESKMSKHIVALHNFSCLTAAISSPVNMCAQFYFMIAHSMRDEFV
jgi:hypothetical protein